MLGYRLRLVHEQARSRFSTFSRLFTTTSSSPLLEPNPVKTPVTILSGFLGAGKTSFLDGLISNTKGTKYGLVVNDMASINIDSQQMKKRQDEGGAEFDQIQLENGCVCCSLGEDLLMSVSQLSYDAVRNNKSYDHIVVECSGIAEPRNIREMFQQADQYDADFLRFVKLDTLVTVVDVTLFLDSFGSNAGIDSRTDLVAPPDASGEAAKVALHEAAQNPRKVTDLLLEQVECADIVLINKIDLLKNANDAALVERVIRIMNPTCRIIQSIRGIVQDPLSIVGTTGGLGAANVGILEEHRTLVESVEGATCHTADCSNPAHDHHHDHLQEDEHHHHQLTHAHEHSHSHDHGIHGHGHVCADPTHDHDHDHSHSHSHDHGDGDGDAVCTTTGCTDPTHDHSHDDHHHTHKHGSSTTTAQDRFGISSFVYKRRRPFHPVRFSKFLKSIGDVSVKGLDDMSIMEGRKEEYNATTTSSNVTSEPINKIAGVLLRSKGFMWMASSKSAAYFMSHAGQYLEVTALGRWWHDMAPSEWPQGMEAEILQEFNVNKEILASFKSDGDSDSAHAMDMLQTIANNSEHGDRRIELVFIGQFNEPDAATDKTYSTFEKLLDACLLTDAEMKDYCDIVADLNADANSLLRDKFVGGPPKEEQN